MGWPLAWTRTATIWTRWLRWVLALSKSAPSPCCRSRATLPRLFRYPEAEAIINRMGFNNDGVDATVDNIKRSRFQGVLGINIGKNALTPMERAVDDYPPA